jgi:peroxiredoxin
MKLPKTSWVLAGLLFAAVSVAIHYQVKVAMHERTGSVQQLRKLKVGQPAPDFTLSDLDGKSVSLSSFREQKAVVLDFWATWCGPCRMALPDLQEITDKYRDRGLQVFAVDQGESAEQVRFFFSRRQYSLSVLIDRDNVVGGSYGIRALPTSVIVDKNGIVKSIFVGSVSASTLGQNVERALSD